jgi:hypothetical protein
MPDLKRMIVATPRSSAIESIGYNPITQELFILFNKNGRYPEYVFGGVASEVASEFMIAGSKGSYYNENIKGNKRLSVGKPLGSFRLGALGRRVRNVFRFK